MPPLSIIIPTLNEAAHIVGSLELLAPLRARGVEVIVADGGSNDGTPDLARAHCDQVVRSTPGRSVQMNAGCEYCSAGALGARGIPAGPPAASGQSPQDSASSHGSVLLFLHADSRLPPDADRLILDGLAASGKQWGRFDVAIEGRHPLLPMVAWFMNRRSRLTGIATGDQGIFVTRAAFESAGRYANILLMEDIALCKKLNAISAPLCLSQRITTSGRRWEKHGLWRTIWLMWTLRARYALGADPADLHAAYYGK